MFSGNCRASLGETKLSFSFHAVSGDCNRFRTCLSASVKVLIDDAIKLENYGIVPRLALTVLGVVILKAFMQFLHGFLGRLGTTWLMRYETPAMKNCNFYRSVTMIRLGPGI